MSDLVGGGGACDVPQPWGLGEVYRSGAIELRRAVLGDGECILLYMVSGPRSVSDRTRIM